MAQAAAAVIGPAPPDVVDVREVGHPQERQTVPPDRPMFGADEGLSQMFWLLIVAVGRTMMGLRIRRTHKSLTSEALVAGTDTATKAVPLKMDSPCRGEALKVRAMSRPCPVPAPHRRLLDAHEMCGRRVVYGSGRVPSVP
jgi:hypothetical protein